MRALLSMMILLGFASLAQAQTTIQCVVCRQAITNAYRSVTSPAWRDPQPVCQTCIQLNTRCFVCNLPVKPPARKLEDGRLLCPREAAAAVLSQVEAERIFEEARRDLVRLLSGRGVLPERNCSVKLVDAPEMVRLYQMRGSLHDSSHTLGLTHTQQLGPGRWEHQIYLLNGLSHSRLLAVCAHEYAHAWLHENLSRDRRLQPDTVEGFCELVAYKIMAERREELEMRVILANDYTKGMVGVLIKADDNYRFYRVVDWMKTGLDDSLSATNAVRLLALQDTPPPELVWQPQTRTPVPASLMLKGISGKPGARFALINDRTFALSELGRVRVGESNVTLRCLEIRDNS